MSSTGVGVVRGSDHGWLWVGYLLAGVLLAVAALSFAFSRPALAAELSRTPDANTLGTNGRVSAILKVDNRIYLGGSFTQVTRPDGTTVTRNRLAAIDANTGQLVENWAPRANGKVLALAASPDGRRIYAGGEFTTVSGASHLRLAAIGGANDPNDGRVDNSWSPDADLAVRSLAVSGNGNVYLGGDFTAVNGTPRSHLALVNAAGVLDTNWNPNVTGVTVRTLAFSPLGDLLYAGGDFSRVSGEPRSNLAALDPVSGAGGGWSPNPARPLFDLAVDGARVYTV